MEAVDGAVVLTGHVYIAPGGLHLRVERSDDGLPVLTLDDGAAVWGVRPCADFLFASAARTFGAETVGVVLTGMGRDGAEGLHAVRAAGGSALIQSRESCIIAGMPDAALARAGADAVVPLDGLAEALTSHVVARRAVSMECAS